MYVYVRFYDNAAAPSLRQKGRVIDFALGRVQRKRAGKRRKSHDTVVVHGRAYMNVRTRALARRRGFLNGGVRFYFFLGGG